MSKKKLARKCEVCGDEPAYFQKRFGEKGGYLCQKHTVRLIKKLLVTGALAATAIIILALLS